MLFAESGHLYKSLFARTRQRDYAGGCQKSFPWKSNSALHLAPAGGCLIAYGTVRRLPETFDSRWLENLPVDRVGLSDSNHWRSVRRRAVPMGRGTSRNQS